MKEQTKYDQMLLSLLDRLQRVLPLADKVADQMVSEETDLLVKIMPQMFEVMQKISKFLCKYVKRGRFSRWAPFWTPQMLMIAGRTGDALLYSEDKEMVDAMDAELANIIEDFTRAVHVETLGLAERIGKHTLPQYRVSQFSVALCRTSSRASRARSPSTQAS